MYLGLSVRDVRRSADSYRAFLDLQVERESFAGPTGLDHVEFEVATMEELEEWRKRLDQLGIPWTRNRSHLLTFRDPDNIQLEFFVQRTEA